jgi:hypothetical protein
MIQEFCSVWIAMMGWFAVGSKVAVAIKKEEDREPFTQAWIVTLWPAYLFKCMLGY